MGVRATHGLVRQSASAKLNGARDRRLVPRGQLNGYRLIVVRDADRVRLITRNGHDWSGRFPWITEAALNQLDRARAALPAEPGSRKSVAGVSAALSPNDAPCSLEIAAGRWQP